ncbi:hypothetical protein SAMN05192551_10664 [Tindallia magadiensis]|uniref:Uncharacterized protein n=1 Tax=Tindallia magadiensis TaxID=69895 RepID=A0A1I3FA41_9FIRM|nr:hypothetical protein [Tindallia magadiensis]SFI08068.1 hypothetical protein SAMN05192551_10664 [Tindallia magadiensis]
MNKAKIQIVVASIIATSVTWFISHEMGYGAIIANGVVGVIAAALLPAALAGPAYAASFVGMSGLNVLPNFAVAMLGGLVCGMILSFTGEIFAGIGGKGGTTAALSGQITRFISNLFM